ncbi:RNA polymerase sigma factor [Alkaliphilus peptidifermentans]|uniref:RNA polymerase sigma factor n=1 Tax=Alkaliphilus peptidifermentans TaxID=426129 RepID=UPI0015A3EF60|nr:sigma-70 family RNA polymerase sigma factor [Alkaliphilus peptidifermentans]
MSQEEISLIEESQQGDMDSFEKLIQPYQKKAFNIAYRMLGNLEDANDVTQEALIKIYKSIDKFKGNSQFSTWLYSIVSNSCIDYIRKNRKGKILYLDKDYDSGEGTYQLEVPDEENTPEYLLERKETQNMIQDAINQLNYEHREVIILREIEGFTYQEISEILKCSEGTVKSRISRARSSLRSLLGEKMKA